MKPQPKRRKKLKDNSINKKLDKLVSEVVRLETPYCVVCGAVENLQCGHYVSRVYRHTRWHPWNVHTQCASCNVKHEYDTIPYTMFMITKYGEGILEKLESLAKDQKKMDLLEKEQLLDYWTDRKKMVEERT